MQYRTVIQLVQNQLLLLTMALAYIIVCIFILTSADAFTVLPSSQISRSPSPSSPSHLILQTTSQPQQQPVSSKKPADLFPVIKKIAGYEWNGLCRYVNEELNPVTNLKLVGGLRYDLNGTTCTLSSFLTFPNGNTREVVMQGIKNDGRPSMRLDSTAEDGGPIYMILTELGPDTILINEVDKASKKIIMTSSLSVVNGGKELVQVSHEVGDGNVSVEGHQVWRLKQVPIEYDDFGVSDTTAR